MSDNNKHSDHEYPTQVIVTRKEDVGREDTGQSAGMTRKAAITGQSASICGSVMTAEPHSKSAIHTHDDQDTIVYGSRGIGKIVFDGGRREVQVGPGDFALIPKYCEHQEVNESDEEIEWIIMRSGSVPAVNNLENWSSQ